MLMFSCIENCRKILHFSHCCLCLCFKDIPAFQVPSYVMLGISKHEEAPPSPKRPLSPMGEACSRMDLTAIHQILVMTHYRDDEGTNEVFSLIRHPTLYWLSILNGCCKQTNVVIFSRMDPTNERYARIKETRRLCIS